MKAMNRGALAGKRNPLVRLMDHGFDVRGMIGADEIRRSGALLATNCCREKFPRSSPAPHRSIYRGRTQIRTYGFATSHGLPCATLNDYNGIFFDDDPVPPYDIHPGQLTAARLYELGLTIGRRCRSRGVAGLVYYQPAPLKGTAYFVMLSVSGLPVIYTTKLDIPGG